MLYSSCLIPVIHSRGPRSCSICLAHITSRRKRFKRYFEYWQSCWVLCNGPRGRLCTETGHTYVREQVLIALGSGLATSPRDSGSRGIFRNRLTHQPERQPSSIAPSLIECCPGGRADQNVSPKFFGLSVSAILVVYHANVVAVRMFREIAHFSMIGALPVRARVKP